MQSIQYFYAYCLKTWTNYLTQETCNNPID